MFAKPKDGPPELPKPVDIVSRFKGLRLLTWAEAEDMYISEMLGQLQKSGFLFKQDVSRGWGALSQDDLFVLITYAKANMALAELQKYRAVAAAVAPPPKNPVQAKKSAKRASGMLDFMAAKGKKSG